MHTGRRRAERNHGDAPWGHRRFGHGGSSARASRGGRRRRAWRNWSAGAMGEGARCVRPVARARPIASAWSAASSCSLASSGCLCVSRRNATSMSTVVYGDPDIAAVVMRNSGRWVFV